MAPGWQGRLSGGMCVEDREVVIDNPPRSPLGIGIYLVLHIGQSVLTWSSVIC